MWFYPKVMLNRFIATIAIAGISLLAAVQARAIDGSAPEGIELPKGEMVADLEWSSEGRLIMLVVKDDGYALRGVEPAEGEVFVIPVPRDFGNIRHEYGYDEELVIELAPGGGSIAVLERTANPLYANELSVYLISLNGLVSLDTHRIPDEFNPNEICYSADGDRLFLAARPYVNPEQPYSVGRFDLVTERFEGVVPKSNLDLIDAMACVPGQDKLALICRSYRGEFPLEPLLVLAGSGDPVLHAAARGFALVPLADGRLLFGDTGGPLGREVWVLTGGSTEVAAVELPEGLNASYQCNRSGSWLGMLRGYDADAGMENDCELVLQNAAEMQTLETTERCSMFVFSPGGAAVCAVGDEGQKLFFYNLPT
jgi:hypothetical protein